MSVTGFILRRVFRYFDEKRDAGLTTPANVIRWNDIQYGPDSRWNLLDVYRPGNSGEKRLPVIVSVHGGGWVYGDKERYQYYCMSLAEQGFAVVNFTYRLAPQYKFPAPLEDTNRVFTWVLEHADEYNLDSEHVFGVGDSVGAHTLGLFCCLCINPDYAAVYPFKAAEGFSPKAVALNCGAYDFENGGRMLAGLLADSLSHKGTPEELRLISMGRHITQDFPPCFIMTCEGDFLAKEALPMAKKLQDIRVPVEYHYYGDKEHTLGHVFHCNIRIPEAQQCNRDECDFFRGYCDS